MEVTLISLSRHRGQILGSALYVSTHRSVTCTRQEATIIFRHIRHCRRIAVRWRPRIHGCVKSAVPPRLGSCPPPLVGGLSSFQHTGRDRGQVRQAHNHREHRNTRRRRHPGIPASHAHVPEHVTTALRLKSYSAARFATSCPSCQGNTYHVTRGHIPPQTGRRLSWNAMPRRSKLYYLTPRKCPH